MKRIQSISIVVLTGLIIVACNAPSGSNEAESRKNANVESVAAPVAEVAQADVTAVPEGLTVPRPDPQRGNDVVPALPDGSSGAQAFVQFYNQTYLQNGPQIPVLGAQDVVWFPPQKFGDTNLEAVHRGIENPQNPCDNPVAYPIICEQDFTTGENCQTCHDSALFVTGGGLPEMAYFSENNAWLANWSQYGDWSGSIMRLASRDPVWQAQIETETQVHSGADPTVIQDVCFRCHGEMGERQLQADHEESFCTDVFYATIPGIVPTEGRGKAYPFSDSCAPIDDQSVGDHPQLYAKYGSMARDGVSCETCHRLGPPGQDSGAWDGEDVDVFYGTRDPTILTKQDNPVPLEHDFTATFEYNMNLIFTPDPKSDLDAGPMSSDDNLDIAQGYNTKDGVSYLRQSILCGSCHVLIVPKIPTVYAANAPIPQPGEYPYYDANKPSDCTASTFAADANPVTDPCVPVAYEQATYLEWINSAFASEQDNENTCQGCHMPFVTDPADPGNHAAIMAQATQGLTPKQYRRHRFMGINMFVFQMFAQFSDVLGVNLKDAKIPVSGTSSSGETAPFLTNNLLNGEMSIVAQATSQANGNGLDPSTGQPAPQAAAEISIDSLGNSDGNLVANLTITNNAGHKFPSGAGFRRAFIKFEVLDAGGNTLWVSGDTNAFGGICNGPCVESSPGQYNLLASEITGGDPKKLQPHYSVISEQDQVQIYEVATVDDAGQVTSSTLALFHDAKDNRILPRGWTPPEQIGCAENPEPGSMIFGIRQCSAAYATEPQLEPLTIGSTIASDPHYSDPSKAGSDTLTYSIPMSDLNGTPASVRATMQYQTIPPAYLAARFVDGYDSTTGKLLPATEREVYVTSHLNTDLGLKSTHPDNPDLAVTEGWTMNIYQAESQLD